MPTSSLINKRQSLSNHLIFTWIIWLNKWKLLFLCNMQMYENVKLQQQHHSFMSLHCDGLSHIWTFQACEC